VFTFERWNKHRNSMRYSKHLLHMFTSRVFRQLLGPVLAVMALGLAVGVYETLVAVSAGLHPLLPCLLVVACSTYSLHLSQKPSLFCAGKLSTALCSCPKTTLIMPTIPLPPAMFLPQTGALPGHWPHVTLALGQGFNLTAFALSLLLVFRTNSSYDRWWEARKLWGGVVNRSRDIVRQVRSRVLHA
jgi:hypothetical protein